MEITATMSPPHVGPFATRMALWDEYEKFVGVHSFDIKGEKGPQALRTHARGAAAAAEVPPPPPLISPITPTTNPRHSQPRHVRGCVRW